MLWGSIKDGSQRRVPMTMLPKHMNREDSMGSLDVSSYSSESNDSFNNTTRRSSQLSDVFPYLDEETQDAVFYQEPEEEYEFILDSAPLLAQKMEKEITHLFHKKNSGPTELVGLMDTMNKLSCHLLELSDNEPYGIKGARVILKLRNLNGIEEVVGSFMLDPNTVSTFEMTVLLEQGNQFSTSLRSWFGQITNGTKSIQIGTRYSIRKKDLYTSARECVTFHQYS